MMKTINVVSLVAVGSISALLLCWSRHDPPKSGAPPTPLSTVSVATGIAGDSTAMPYGMCCQATATSNAEDCTANLKDDQTQAAHFAACASTD